MTNNTAQTPEKAQQLFLRSWEYNAALILDELEKIVINRGGAIVSTWQTENRKRYLIVNRSLLNAIWEHEEIVKRFEAYGKNAPLKTVEELEKLKSIPNEPKTSRNGSFLYLQFVLDGMYYSYNMDDNPFFDFSFSKIPVTGGKLIDRDRYAISDNKEWFLDCLWRFDCNDVERREIAHQILNMLELSKTSEPYRGNRKPEKIYFLEGNEEALK